MSRGYITVSIWERGERQPEQETIHKIALEFDVPMDYLTGRISNPTAMPTDREMAEMAEAEELQMLQEMVESCV